MCVCARARANRLPDSVCVCVCVCVRARARAYVGFGVRVCASVCLRACLCVCVRACLCVRALGFCRSTRTNNMVQQYKLIECTNTLHGGPYGVVWDIVPEQSRLIESTAAPESTAATIESTAATVAIY